MAKKHFSLIFIFIALFSCSDHELDKTADAERIKTHAIDSLSKTYNILYRWDTLDARNRRSLYTIDFNPVTSSAYQIIGKFKLNDIFKKDSVTYASIVTGRYRSFYFDFPINRQQGNQLAQKDERVILIVHITEIQKLKNPTDFAGKGEIIKIFPIAN